MNATVSEFPLDVLSEVLQVVRTVEVERAPVSFAATFTPTSDLIRCLMLFQLNSEFGSARGR